MLRSILNENNRNAPYLLFLNDVLYYYRCRYQDYSQKIKLSIDEYIFRDLLIAGQTLRTIYDKVYSTCGTR